MKMAVLLLWERSRGRASPVWGYVEQLPSSIDTPVRWDEAELAELQYAPAISEVGCCCGCVPGVVLEQLPTSIQFGAELAELQYAPAVSEVGCWVATLKRWAVSWSRQAHLKPKRCIKQQLERGVNLSVGCHPMCCAVVVRVL